MSVDIRAAAEREAERQLRHMPGFEHDWLFVAGAVWAQSRLTTTRELIEEAVRTDTKL